MVSPSLSLAKAGVSTRVVRPCVGSCRSPQARRLLYPLLQYCGKSFKPNRVPIHQEFLNGEPMASKLMRFYTVLNKTIEPTPNRARAETPPYSVRSRPWRQNKHKHGAAETVAERVPVSCKLYLGEDIVGPVMECYRTNHNSAMDVTLSQSSHVDSVVAYPIHWHFV